MARTYSLNDLGVTADDLILLDASGYSFDETDNISEEKRDEILSRLYDLKQKAKENAPQEAPSGERKTPEIPAATDEQLKDMNYRLKHGEHLSAQEVASAVARGGIVSKDMRAEIKNAIVSFTNADNVSEEEAGAVSYLLDELDGKHVEKHKNGHSVEEYKKQFADSPEILEAAGKKLEDINNAPATVVMYDKEDIDALLKQGEIYLKKPEEVDNHDVLEQANPNYRETHQELFAEHVEQVSSLIKDYAEGRANIYPEALESMEKLVEAYGREYTRGTASSDKFKNGVSYDITQDAANAHQRLASERVAWKKLDKEVGPTLKFAREYPDMVENLVKDIAYAGNDADREKAVAEFNKKMSKAMEEAGMTSEADKERNRAYLEASLKDDQNLFGYLGNEYNDAAKYLLDENGKLKDGVAVYTAPEKEAPVEEKVETKTEDKVEDKGPNKEEVEAAKKKKAKDRTLHDWIVLKEDIEHNPKLSEGQKKYELKSLTDQARTHKMNKSPKELSSDELKDADAFMAAFGYDIDRKGREATNPVAMRWKEAVNKRKKAETANDEIVVEQPVEQKTEQEPEEKKNDGKEEDKGKGGDSPVVIPGRHITNDKGVTEWEEHKPVQEKNKEKKKKGLFGWLKNAGSKAWGWCKRNWKKIAIGGAILAASLFGAKSCNSNQGGDDKGKDKIEVITPTPTPQQEDHQLPEVVVTDSIDQAMLHQYAKRVGYTDQLGEEAAIQKALADRHAYVTKQTKNVKDQIFGLRNNMTPEAQMAILATVRNNRPDLKDTVDGLLDGTNHNVVTAKNLSAEASEWQAVDGKILAVHPEKWTKETGSQSITVSQEKLNEAVQARLNNIRNGNSGM